MGNERASDRIEELQERVENLQALADARKKNLKLMSDVLLAREEELKRVLVDTALMLERVRKKLGLSDEELQRLLGEACSNCGKPLADCANTFTFPNRNDVECCCIRCLDAMKREEIDGRR